MQKVQCWRMTMRATPAMRKAPRAEDQPPQAKPSIAGNTNATSAAIQWTGPLKSALSYLLITLLAGGHAHAASRTRSDRRDDKYHRDTVSDPGSGACTS